MGIFDGLFGRKLPEQLEVFTLEFSPEGIYKVAFLELRKGWETHIIQLPDFGNRDLSWTKTHLIHSELSDRFPAIQYKICVKASHYPKDLERMKKLTSEWASMMEVYRTVGTPLDDQIAQLN